jgi:hypothetical protein
MGEQMHRRDRGHLSAGWPPVFFFAPLPFGAFAELPVDAIDYLKASVFREETQLSCSIYATLKSVTPSSMVSSQRDWTND